MKDIANIIYEFLGPLGGLQGQIVSIIIALITALLIQYFRPNVKLIWGRANNSFNAIPIINEETKEAEKPTTVYTETTFIQNTGKIAGTDVEIVIQGMPNSVSFDPEQNFNVSGVGNGNTVIKLNYIAPKELITLTHLSVNGSAVSIESIRCKEAAGNQVNFTVNRNFGTLFNITVLFLLLLGMAYLLDILGVVLFGGLSE